MAFSLSPGQARDAPKVTSVSSVRAAELCFAHAHGACLYRHQACLLAFDLCCIPVVPSLRTRINPNP
ncbi:hypothetical protein FUT69_01615 [Xylella taiwanensis]|nr:hypothetical protein [Xylella taiwanensis]MCD8457287.1 hypothetical protein [Xylella taiwanensis]MCD8461433.1 hypothetical protein [Xylella taiwanensis]NBI35945.1 hypothetical protein [Xylella taiwanensis]UFN41908.1 hypothetical protein LPH57_03525 [Xylella taiwanensis]UFS50058.1 hypothetical protein LPH54_02600 [Xylella taiwanensis]